MKTMRLLAICSALTLTGAPLASAGDEGPFDLEATGKVVALDKDTMVVKIDEHGHRIPFAIGKDSRVASDIKVGSHVKLDYHATGTTGQTVDEAHVSTATTVLQPVHPDKTSDVARSEKPQPERR